MFNLSKLFVTIFYIGYSKFAPGTLGSVISILIILIIDININKLTFFLIFIFIFIFSIFSINIYIKNNSIHDPKEIVIDEFIGIYFIFLFIDNLQILNNIFTIVCIFILFRLFDIFKPFPINIIDKNIKNSFGIILDDLLAGIYTIITIKLINEFIKFNY